MNIVVCAKQVPDTETVPKVFRVDQSGLGWETPGAAPVLSIYDELAAEMGLKVKDANPESVVRVITLGQNLAIDVVKKPLAMGADELYLLQDDNLDGGDAFATAYALEAAIRKLGPFDLVICGKQAADWDQGQVHVILAELLDAACVTEIKSVTHQGDNKIVVERVLKDGAETLEVSLPAVVSVREEMGLARYPTMRGIMQARRKEPVVWTSQDLGVDPAVVGAAGRRTKVQRVFVPQSSTECEFIDGENVEEIAEKLAQRLREARII